MFVAGEGDKREILAYVRVQSWCPFSQPVPGFDHRPAHSTFLLFPLGAGSILGVYVTVLVTTSLMCRTLVLLFSHRVLPCAPWLGFISVYRLAFRAASQSKGLLTLLALNGERTGESTLLTAGEGGMRRLGKEVGPVAGADSG